MTDFLPFQDDQTSVEVGGLTVENGRSALVLHGDATIAADRTGLAALERMLAVLGKARDELASRQDLPDRVEVVDPDAVVTVRNPFAGPGEAG